MKSFIVKTGLSLKGGVRLEVGDAISEADLKEHMTKKYIGHLLERGHIEEGDAPPPEPEPESPEPAEEEQEPDPPELAREFHPEDGEDD